MAFVYLLSYNGTPFYVGVTNCLTKRYIKHYTVRDCNSYDVLHNILHDTGNYVDMLPVYFGNRQDSLIKENEFIKKLSLNKILLSNRINNKGNDKLDVNIINYKKPRFPKSLKSKLIQLENIYKILYEQ